MLSRFITFPFNMEILFVSVVAFLVSILTFFSGFGLGTLLAPVFMLFFPVEQAIALTAVVHFCNNLFKLLLVGRNANKEVLLRFGVTAVLGAFAGALLLFAMSDLPALFSYELAGKQFDVYPVKFVIALLLIAFALMDIVPAFERVQFGKDKLVVGGLISGFFGGLSGNQGALRSAFLIRAGLSKEAFIGTAVVVSTFVDLTRLGIYAGRMQAADFGADLPVVVVPTLSAILGAYIGHKLLKKVTLDFLKITVAIMLLLISIALGAGFI